MRFYKNHERVIKRILSVIIPSHSLRYKIRTVLKSDESVWGWCRTARQICKADRRFCKNKSDLPLWAICAIIKDEAPYLREWIEYHKIHGVDKIYIYDNESTDSTMSVLSQYIKDGLIEYNFFPGKCQQLPAYQDCLTRHKHDVRWITFIDLDEFIVPLKNRTLRQILEAMPKNVGQISMEWQCFGSNGHINKPAGLVIENYTKRRARISNRKSIVNPRVVYGPFVHVGDVANKTVFVKGNKLKVNHYYCKSWQEYKRRKMRGDALLGDKFARETFNKATFDEHDACDVTDTTILRYLGLLKYALGCK